MKRSRLNDIHYIKIGDLVISASKKHRFARITVLDGFPFKAGMIEPVLSVDGMTLYKQDLMTGREWTLHFV